MNCKHAPERDGPGQCPKCGQSQGSGCAYRPKTGAEIFKAPDAILKPMIEREMEVLKKHGLLPTDAAARKNAPMHRGLLAYFPRALAAVAELSRVGNEQHNPGQPMHWAKEKSNDHGDCIVRHQCDAGTLDTDGQRHSTKVAWRALAQLEIELETAGE